MKRFLDKPALTLFALFVSAILCGCGQKTPAAISGSAKPAVDISKKVTLNIVTFGAAAPRDMEMINKAASEITLKKLNCEINVQVMADWRTRYKLALSSGEPIDLMWSAMWYSYQPYAFDGAWLDITEMVDRVAPELRTLVGQDTWKMSRIKGRDYAIPNINRNYFQWGVAWREDLRKRYKLPEIKDWETMEEYAKAIKKNEPGMIPFCDSPSGGLWHSFSEKNHAYVGLGNPQFSYGLGVKTDNPRDLFVFHKTEAFKQYAATQRRWVKNGYVQPDVASSTDQGGPGMLSGKYAGALAMIPAATLASLLVPARQKHPDWEIGYLNYGEMFKWTYRAHPTFMAFSLPKSSPNPERVLLFVKELMTNDELYRILDMGIQGTHYKIEDGKYVSLNDPLNPGYLQGSSGLTDYIFNKNAKLYSKDYTWVIDYAKKHMDPYEVANYFEGFPEDFRSYSEKVTAMSEINTQFTWPVLRGAVENPEKAIDDLNARLDKAGREEVVKSVITQYNAYLDGMGVK